MNNKHSEINEITPVMKLNYAMVQASNEDIDHATSTNTKRLDK